MGAGVGRGGGRRRGGREFKRDAARLMRPLFDDGVPWPPPDDPTAGNPGEVAGWEFPPGEAAFAGVRFPLSVAPHRNLLERFATARRRLGPDDLRDAAGDDPAYRPEWGTVRGYLSRLRDDLRAAFGLPRDADPIPGTGRGTAASWELDSDLLRRAAQEQRNGTR